MWYVEARVLSLSRASKYTLVRLLNRVELGTQAISTEFYGICGKTTLRSLAVSN